MGLLLKVWDWEIKLDPLSKPSNAIVEISTSCNLSCIHCFRYASRELRYVDMDLELFRAILKNVVESGIRRIVFSGWGEPTVNPFFTEMLKEARKAGVSVAVNTNGVLLKDLVNAVVDHEVEELYVSLNAITIHGKTWLERESAALIEGMKRLVALKRSRGLDTPVIKAIFTVSGLNVDQLPKLLDLAADMGVEELYLSHYIHHPGGLGNVECLSDANCVAKLLKYVREMQLKLVSTPIRLWIPNTGSYTARQCPYTYSKAIFIRVDGKVAPCMYMAYTWRTRIRGVEREIREFLIGDSTRESVVKIWQRNAHMLFRLFFNYIPSCLDCDLVESCSYTRSNEVDCWGNTPNCAHCPYHYKLVYCPV